MQWLRFCVWNKNASIINIIIVNIDQCELRTTLIENTWYSGRIVDKSDLQSAIPTISLSFVLFQIAMIFRFVYFIILLFYYANVSIIILRIRRVRGLKRFKFIVEKICSPTRKRIYNNVVGINIASSAAAVATISVFS